MAYESVTAPGKIGKLEIKNRITLSPMEKNWCDRLGNPTQAYIDYYAERARHGVGLMNFEATYIDARGRGNLFQLGLWSDENVAAHRRLNDAVHAHGCRTAAELNHGGRNANTHRTGLQPVGPSNCPSAVVGGHQLHELSVEEIAAVVQSFRDGARRAMEAGYDAITIHAAHGYLITSFLSHVNNQRTDSYGGSDENRWRFATEVYQAIRDEAGPDVPVGIRISAEEDVEGGYKIDSMIGLVRQLEGLGLDYVDVSTGLYESLEFLIQPMDMQQGCLLPLARQVKSAVSIPVFAAGRINDIDIAERALSGGDCDFVHMGRAFHADPRILVKTLDGRKDEVVGCIACNKCCAELFQNKPSVCTVNIDAGRERFSTVVATDRARKVMVVGGGMAGMEAARLAAQRGHQVTLFEKTGKLGGWINVLRAPRNRLNWGRAMEDRARMVERAGVNVVMGKSVTAADVRSEKPDVLIVATGTKPFMPRYVAGIDEEMVTNYDDIIRGRVDVGVNVIVVGGQNLGLTTAEFVAEKGGDVTVIEATDGLAGDLEYMAQKMLLARIAASHQIQVRKNSNIELIGSDFVDVQSGGKIERLEDVDQVVFAIERAMEIDLINEVTGSGLIEELGIEYHAIGDCTWPGEPYDAVRDGNAVARAI
ncbi:MAG: FAD-dependent oxidoreductase [Bauldia sp.]|uniref:oxidoreductase n=1 Tax=Bauldia sp. TaxID=2575872 RepID=UPI001D857819|nr:FAD-dependent oxidoreductase [Bauldia sp.]MCB1494343.1 FAD-dependent oxidoreductase [Bauldia sp.]